MPVPDSAAYRRTVAVLLMVAYTFNSMDRSLISIIASPIKADLRLTDTQLGLLGGTAFALLYAFGGIPIARLAERISRVNIIGTALILWSGLTALCAAAGTFVELLAIRVAVGVAEAGCSPAAHSLISDYFPPAERASALSIYSSGISLGYILAAVAGGYLAQHFGWRAACAAVGIPGVLTAILIKAVVREPARGQSDARAADVPAPFSLAEELRELRAVGAALICDPPIRHMVLGVTLGAFAAYGFYAFVPPYYNRVFGLGYAATGYVTALTGGVAVGLGIIAGGFVADALARYGTRWYALVPAIGGVLALPLYVLAVLASDWRTSAWALGAAGFFQYASLGPTFGVVQNAVGIRRRATATAFLYICLSVLALGLGQVFTGSVIDRVAQGDFAGRGASFAASCPGGSALPGAAAGLQLACRSTLSLATRRGLLITVAFFAWAALHYFLAAAGFARSGDSPVRRPQAG
ncbi:MAG TPA: MFS transporter [Steroidobacteraceae bacterium]|nr:MFS transporter [Steroidobacteraceae bacterium]